MTIDEIIQLLNARLPKPLTPLQELILRESWQGNSYHSVAQKAYYSAERIRKVAAELWPLLSEIWDESIHKTNFRNVLEPRVLMPEEQQRIQPLLAESQMSLPEFPNSPLSLNSPFYISRPPIEELAFSEIMKPGSVLRIQAPRKMGKSSLLIRILDHAARQHYRTVTIDFLQAEQAIFTSVDKFLRWFSANVSRQLNLQSQLNHYWNQEIGSKVSCSLYFEDYIFPQIPHPIVLALNEVDRLFLYPEIAQEFLPLLRFWYEQSRHVQIWQKLRMIIVYSTEVDLILKLNQSPFNIGLPLKLPPFTLYQIHNLAQQYGLEWVDDSDAQQLMTRVGGHPYLVQLAFYELINFFSLRNPAKADVYSRFLADQKIRKLRQQRFKQILQEAPTDQGIYRTHLRHLLATLEEQPQLKAALKKIISSPPSVTLEPNLIYILDSLGIVKTEQDQIVVSCELYRLYFQQKLI